MRSLFVVFILGTLLYAGLLVTGQLDEVADAGADLSRAVGLDADDAPGWGQGSDIEVGRTSGSMKLYRWRDASGGLVISDQPPPDGVPAEVQHIQRSSTQSADRTPPGVTARTENDAAPIGASKSAGDTPISLYGPEGLERLQRRTEDTARLLEERRRTLESLQKQL